MGQQPVKLVTNFGNACLTVVPVEPLTGEDIANLLNDGAAVESGDEIVQWAEPPAEGGRVVARIVSNTCEQPQKVWAVEKTGNCKPCLSTPITRDVSRVDDLYRWAWDFLRQGRFTETEEVLTLAYTLLESAGNPSAERFLIQTAHAQMAQQRGDTTRCARLCEEALDSARLAFGEPHASTAIAQCNLAEAYSGCGRFAAAKPLMDEGLRVLRDPAFISDQYDAERLAALVSDYSEVERRINKATAASAVIVVSDGQMIADTEPAAQPADGDSSGS